MNIFDVDFINKYFPLFSDVQKEQFSALPGLYREWNDKINVISRKDVENIELHHLLHSLAIAKYINFTAGSKIMDLGSGGGLPGIPLAIAFPGSHFHLIDRIGKKMKVAENIASQLGLNNVSIQHGDLGECHEKFDFIVNRGVMPQADIVKAVRKNISSVERNALPNGVISLKGGDLTHEVMPVKAHTEIVDISNYFDEPFFETKKIVYTSI